MTSIEWTDETLNAFVGCSITSPGCARCYAMKQAAWIARVNPELEHYRGLTQPSKAGPVWTGKLALAPDSILLKPLHWKKPRRIFVNSMSDLFHEDVPDAWIDRVFAVMALCPQHTFQVLTKRSKRMRLYFADVDLRSKRIAQAILDLMIARLTIGVITDDNYPFKDGQPDDEPRLAHLPLRNVWLGVSAEDQTRADERIPDLLATPAAVRFVSAEPLLGPIDFTRIDHRNSGVQNALNGEWSSFPITRRNTSDGVLGTINLHPPKTRLDWIIAGGESGSGARRMHPDWARSIRDQCAAAGVPFFFKQWGEWLPVDPGELDGTKRDWKIIDGQRFHRLGKRRAGRLLDGVEHSAFPEMRP